MRVLFIRVFGEEVEANDVIAKVKHTRRLHPNPNISFSFVTETIIQIQLEEEEESDDDSMPGLIEEISAQLTEQPLVVNIETKG